MPNSEQEDRHLMRILLGDFTQGTHITNDNGLRAVNSAVYTNLSLRSTKRFILKKLNVAEGEQSCRVEVSKRSTALEDWTVS
jgi:hypothetical protein